MSPCSIPYVGLSMLLLAVSGVSGEQPAAAGKASRNVVIRREPEAEPTTAVIGLQSITYEEIEPVCRQLLSPDGTMGYLRQRRALIVHDQRRIVDQIKQLVAQVDRPPVNIRIAVEFLNEEMSRDSHLDVTLNGSRRGPEVVIRNGRIEAPESVTIRGGQQRTQTMRNTTQQVLALSGSPARLWVGRTVPQAQWLRRYRFIPIGRFGRRQALSEEVIATVSWRDVGSALYVTPTLLENGLIDIELFPTVSYLDGNGRRQVVRVQEIGTRVQVRDGQRVELGGGDQATQQFMSQLFGPELFRKSKAHQSLAIALTPTLMRRPPPAPRN